MSKLIEPSTSLSTRVPYEKLTMNKECTPLVQKMRPANVAAYVGQNHIIGTDTILYDLLKKREIPSMIFWGPPGCGKTSLIHAITEMCKEKFEDSIHIVKLVATTSGIGDIKKAIETAKNGSKFGLRTIVNMDKIHRFNKLQQDIFLPNIEAGTFTLIGETVENPSYSLNPALLSRCRVFALNKLAVIHIKEILRRTVKFVGGSIYDLKENSARLNKNVSNPAKFTISHETFEWLAEMCDGDAGLAINSLEMALRTKKSSITFADVKESLTNTHMLNNGETTDTHHLYSALHKSIRASEANAALYWLARIMAVKEDPVDIARRLVRISSEDIGLADSDALGIAVHTLHGCQLVGMPECDVFLSQCTVYLARAPKSRLVYNALHAAKEIIINHNGPQPSVPLHIRCKAEEENFQAGLGSTQGRNFL